MKKKANHKATRKQCEQRARKTSKQTTEKMRREKNRREIFSLFVCRHRLRCSISYSIGCILRKKLQWRRTEKQKEDARTSLRIGTLTASLATVRRCCSRSNQVQESKRKTWRRDAIKSNLKQTKNQLFECKRANRSLTLTKRKTSKAEKERNISLVSCRNWITDSFPQRIRRRTRQESLWHIHFVWHSRQ